MIIINIIDIVTDIAIDIDIVICHSAINNILRFRLTETLKPLSAFDKRVNWSFFQALGANAGTCGRQLIGTFVSFLWWTWPSLSTDLVSLIFLFVANLVLHLIAN
jgi:hypothetical protein